MPTATLIEATEKLGISFDDLVTYHQEKDIGIIEIYLKKKNRNKPIHDINDKSLKMGRELLIDFGNGFLNDKTLPDDIAENHDQYLYGEQ